MVDEFLELWARLPNWALTICPRVPFSTGLSGLFLIVLVLLESPCRPSGATPRGGGLRTFRRAILIRRVSGFWTVSGLLRARLTSRTIEASKQWAQRHPFFDRSRKCWSDTGREGSPQRIRDWLILANAFAKGDTESGVLFLG